jgi:hypothetical protein
MEWTTPSKETYIAHNMTEIFSVDAMLHVMSEVGQDRRNTRIFRHCSNLRMYEFLSRPVL